MIEKYDFSQFINHAHQMANTSDNIETKACHDQNYMLRFWERAKSQYLYRMFGEELILSKEVSFDKARSELADAVDRCLTSHAQFYHALFTKLEECLHPEYVGGWCHYPANDDAKFIDAVRELFNAYNLIDCRVTQNAVATLLGHQVTLTEGQKSMRAIGRIAELLSLKDEYEAFRIAHSQALNQKRVKGVLNLSIHPLDYATASDNEAGWSSCMSWMEEGCYRLGTVEMMNSPMVICAYLSSEHPMYDVGGKEWNSKKWRAWMIVTKDIILVNRQYPYTNTYLATEAINWVKELACSNLDWHYSPAETDLDYSTRGFVFETNYMYNDVSGDHPGAYRWDLDHGDEINFSGIAQCMWCGEEIEYYGNSDDAGTLTCLKCSGTTECVCCGNHIHHRDDIHWSPDNEPYCMDCYYERFLECEKCADLVDKDDTTRISYRFDPEFIAELVNQYGPDSCAFKYYDSWHYHQKNGSPITADDIFNCNGHSIFCSHCLREAGIRESDIVFDCAPVFETYASRWMRFNYLDPTKVGFESFRRLFTPYNDYSDEDGTLTKVFRMAYDHYRNEMIRQGIADI